MGFSFSKLFRKANPLAVAKKGLDLGKKFHRETHIRPLQRTGKLYQSAFDTTKHNIGNVTDRTGSPSLGGIIYRNLVEKPRDEQEARQAEEQRRAADMAARRSNAATTSVLAQGQGALQDVRGGYGKALGQLDPLRAAELNKLREQSAIAGAQTQQAAVARGTYNTSLAEDARRGVATETARATADLESRYASIRAGLELGKAESLASVQSQIAGQVAAAGQTSAAITQNRANALANLDVRDPREYLNQLLGIAGTVGGIAYGSSRNYPNTPGV